MPFDIVFGLLFKLLFLSFVGFFLLRKGFINADFQKKLSRILLQIVLPLNVIVAAHQEYSADTASRLSIVTLIAVLYHVGMYAGSFLFTRKLSMPLDDKNMFTNMLSLGNVAFMGIPITQELFGSEGVLAAVIFTIVFHLSAFTVGVHILGQKTSILSIFKSPMVIASIISTVIFFTPLKLPSVLVDSFAQVGNMTTPLAMIIVGASLAYIRVIDIIREKWGWVLTIIRQFLVPGVIAFVMWFIGLEGIVPSVVLVLSTMPAATNNVIFAQEYNKDVAFTTRCVVLGTLMTPVSLVLAVWVSGILF